MTTKRKRHAAVTTPFTEWLSRQGYYTNYLNSQYSVETLFRIKRLSDADVTAVYLLVCRFAPGLEGIVAPSGEPLSFLAYAATYGIGALALHLMGKQVEAI